MHSVRLIIGGILMHAIDIIIVAVVIVLAAYIVIHAWKNRGKCCHGCKICSDACRKQDMDNDK